jgi:hypothetical protein
MASIRLKLRLIHAAILSHHRQRLGRKATAKTWLRALAVGAAYPGRSVVIAVLPAVDRDVVDYHGATGLERSLALGLNGREMRPDIAGTSGRNEHTPALLVGPHIDRPANHGD